MRPLLTSATLLTLLFAACIGLIHAQPYDDSELRAFLTPPEGCPMPCFMGIRPGVTTAGEALSILETHPWVETIDSTGYGSRVIQITWNPQHMGFIDSSRHGILAISLAGEIAFIVIPTTITAGYTRLMFGEPQAAEYGPYGGAGGISVSNVYRAQSLSIETIVFCPLSFEGYMMSQVLLIFSNDLRETSQLPYFDRRLRRLQNQYC